jgi:hypothetical protein
VPPGTPFAELKAAQKNSEWNRQGEFPWLVASEFAGWWGFAAKAYAINYSLEISLFI